MKCLDIYVKFFVIESSSPRRAWIEILIELVRASHPRSSSPRRAWIEMTLDEVRATAVEVVLPTEGVD